MERLKHKGTPFFVSIIGIRVMTRSPLYNHFFRLKKNNITMAIASMIAHKM